MLQTLTAYLLQYRTVSIPHVGTVQLVQHPAQANVVDKRILPPSFTAQLNTVGDEVSTHQLAYLMASLQKSSDVVALELKDLGSRLYDAVNGPGFEWVGIGHFSNSTTLVAIDVEGLQPVEAQKLIRENPNHAVLVGDRETTSLQLADERAEAGTVKRKRDVLVIIGWVLLGLSVLAIVYLLYSGKFNVGAAGSKLRATSWYVGEASSFV